MLFFGSILAGLATVWLAFTAWTVWAGRTGRRRTAWIGTAGSLLAFLPVWACIAFGVGEFFGMPLEETFRPQTGISPFPPGTSWILCGIALATAGLMGIASLWAALGQPHWFLRVFVAGALLGIFVLVGAYELWLVYFSQFMIAVAPLLFAKEGAGWRLQPPCGAPSGRGAEHRGIQFGVRDLLLATVLAAAVLGVVNSAPMEIWTTGRIVGAPFVAEIPWPYWIMLGIAFGLATLAAAWVVLGRSPAWLRGMGLFLALPVLTCAIWLAIWRYCAPRDGNSHRTALAWAGLIVYSLLVAFPSAAIAWCLIFPPSVPRAALPTRNGYDLVRAAGKSLADAWIPETPAGSAAFVDWQRTTLEKIHDALEQPGQVPVEYSADFASVHWNRNALMRQLARVILVDAMVAAREDRQEHSVRCYGDLLRLAAVTSHGGFVDDLSTALAIEEVSMRTLCKQTPSLDAGQCRSAIRMLAAHDRTREPVEDVLQRDLVWSAHVGGWSWHLSSLADRVAGRLRLDSDSLDLQRAVQRNQARLRIVMTELALRAYLLEHDKHPDRLEELVPEYLPAVPIDPLTGRPIAYYRTGEGYRLQSPGLPASW